MNALRHILNKRGIMQKELMVKDKNNRTVSKQAVSKWVAGDRKIPEEIAQKWEKILKVPMELFRGENGRCRKLSEEEFAELEDYLLLKSVDYGNENLPGMKAAREQVDLYLWDKNLKRRFKSVRRKLYDVVFTHSGEVNSTETYLQSCESNLIWFEEMLDIRKRDLLKRNEWSSIKDAFTCLDLEKTDEGMLEEEVLTCKLYSWIKEKREKEWISIIRAIKLLEHKVPDRDILKNDELACEIYDYLHSCRQEEAEQQRELAELCEALYGDETIKDK